VSENHDQPLTIIQLAKKLIEAGLAPFENFLSLRVTEIGRNELKNG